MAPSPKQQDAKPRKTMKTTPGQVIQLTRDVDEIEAHYGAMLAAWPSLTPRQRQAMLDNSPILSRLMNLLAPLWR